MSQAFNPELSCDSSPPLFPPLQSFRLKTRWKRSSLEADRTRFLATPHTSAA